ncbi:MAG: HK97 family phage prohead protease [Caldilineaceae bacterium]|nr:HK97 family phage prohead protease [Caldilineaceae bacterium]
MELERRFCDRHGLGVTRRAVGEQEVRSLTGYAAVFDTLSVELWGFRERIAKGAFLATLGDDVRALWNHDTNHVLGRTTNATLRLAEDDIGLRVEIDPPSSPMADSFMASVERGDVNQMSFAFRTLEDTWDEDAEGQLIRTLTKVKLYEVSPVTFPAYPATSISARKDELYGIIPEIPKELRRAPDSANGDAAARACFAMRRRRLLLLQHS